MTIGWQFSTSIFKNYRRETQKLLDECFEFDWSCCKLNKVVRDDEI